MIVLPRRTLRKLDCGTAVSSRSISIAGADPLPKDIKPEAIHLFGKLLEQYKSKFPIVVAKNLALNDLNLLVNMALRCPVPDKFLSFAGKFERHQPILALSGKFSRDVVLTPVNSEVQTGSRIISARANEGNLDQSDPIYNPAINHFYNVLNGTSTRLGDRRLLAETAFYGLLSSASQGDSYELPELFQLASNLLIDAGVYPLIDPKTKVVTYHPIISTGTFLGAKIYVLESDNQDRDGLHLSFKNSPNHILIFDASSDFFDSTLQHELQHEFDDYLKIPGAIWRREVRALSAELYFGDSGECLKNIVDITNRFNWVLDQSDRGFAEITDYLPSSLQDPNSHSPDNLKYFAKCVGSAFLDHHYQKSTGLRYSDLHLALSGEVI